MFMAKNELNNTGRLYRIFLRNDKGILWFTIIMGFSLLVNIIINIFWMFGKTDGISAHINFESSSLWMFCISVAFIILNCLYRYNNQRTSVYPQTNNSRFMYFQMITFTFALLVPLTLLVTYLIQYGIVAAIAAFNENIHIIYDFDILFVLSGFVVMTIYTAILAGAINLAFAVQRRFKIATIAFFATLFILVIRYFTSMDDIFSMLFGFLIYESSLWKFILIGLGLWVVLVLMSFIVNKYTVYYKMTKINLKNDFWKTVVTAGFGAVLAIAVVLVTAIMFTRSDIGRKYPTLDDPIFYDHHTMTGWQPVTKKFDISHIPDGSNIDVVVSGDAIILPNSHLILASYGSDKSTTYSYSDGTERVIASETMTIFTDDELKNINGDILTVVYVLPHRIINSVDIGKLLNVEFDVKLEGSTIFVHYTFEKNIKAMFLPIWSFMGQFEYFKGKNLFTADSQKYNSGNDSIMYFMIIEE